LTKKEVQNLSNLSFTLQTLLDQTQKQLRDQREVVQRATAAAAVAAHTDTEKRTVPIEQHEQEILRMRETQVLRER
jgi:hypothetical protein